MGEIFKFDPNVEDDPISIANGECTPQVGWNETIEELEKLGAQQGLTGTEYIYKIIFENL